MHSDPVVRRRRSDRFLPGAEGIWIFLSADAVLFFLLLSSFSYERSLDPLGFNGAQSSLIAPAGIVNTVLLVTSSWFVANAVRSVRRSDGRAAAVLIGSAIAAGVAFAVIKIAEYSVTVQSGHTLTASPFFMFYFVITGIHLLHLVAGLVLLSILLWKLRTDGAVLGHRVLAESAASYWHLVDLLWLLIFPILYLVR